jgi:RHS repeat-associated protein
MPPRNDLEIFMGSKTVSADNEAFSYLAMPVLSCQSIGMPPIPRPLLKKPKAALGLVLPTAVVLAIPCGVFVDGPPTISLMALVFRAGIGALGKLARRARNTRPWRALSNRTRNWANNLAHHLKLGDVARNRARRGACAVTGHPVDVATGKVFTEAVDLALPGPIPLTFERVWYSTSTYRGPLGHGWHHSFDTGLYVTPELILHRTSDGRVVAYPPLGEGEFYFEPVERCTLARTERGYLLQTAEGLSFEFALASTLESPSADVHRLVRIFNRAGHRVELRYSTSGSLREVVDSAGRVISIESDSEGRLASISLPHPERSGETFVAVRYQYDEAGNLTSAVDAAGSALRYFYERHLLVQETGRSGLNFYFQFDARDERARCIRTWGDGGIYDRQITYHPGKTVVVDSLGAVSHYEHEAGLVTRSVDARGATRESRYEHGRLVEWVDALGRRTRCRYDEAGNPTEFERPDGVKLTTEYNSKNQPIESRDAIGGVWRWRYDERGQLIETIDPLGATTRFFYERGFLLGTEDALGQVSRFEYDAHGNLALSIAPGGAATRFAYNALGLPVESVDAQGNTERRYYDIAGRLRRVESVDGNITELDYDAEGRPVRVADRVGEVHLAYSGTGRIAAKSEAGTTLQFSYDTEERLLAIANEHAAIYSFERDAGGAVTRERGFDGATKTYHRDLSGRMVRVEQSSGRASDYEYDALDRITCVRHSDGSEESYAYRRDGMLTRAEVPGQRVSFEHDALGQVVRERHGAHTVEREYDALGRRIRVRTSLGLEETIERDAMGRPTYVRAALADAQLPVFEARFGRNVLGAELERALPFDIQSRWQRDSIGRPLQHEVLHGQTAKYARSYQWDVAERLVATTDSVSGGVRYAHDALGRLAAASYQSGRIELRSPDAVGNVFKRAERADRRYGAAGQLLQSLDAEGRVTTHAYDLNGARSTTLDPDGGAWHYVWNAQGRLIEAIDANGVSTRFEYDALGRRVAKHHRGIVTRWLWDDDVLVHEWVEQGGRSSPVLTWLFEPESHIPLARLQESGEDVVVTDHLGTPVALLDSAGEISWSVELGIWGEARVHRGDPERCPLRWPGQYEDAETGLYYNRFRYYDPRAGQYLCPDPAGLGGGMAPYAYVPDPVAQTDPLGLAANFENLYPEDVPGSRYGVVQLVQRDGVWYEMSGQYQGSRARGLYDFVVIDGEVHAVRMRGRNVVGHVSLANGASVQYAGMVRFGTGTTTRGIVTAWDNGSGHFMPHPGWAHQAPFPRELFSAVDFQPHRAPDSVHGPQLPVIGHGHAARCGL